MMNEKDLNNNMSNDEACGCGCSSEHDHGCGCGSEHDHEHDHGCGCGSEHDHEHDHGCGCGCGEHESIFVDLEDENGNTVSCEVVDNFTFEDGNYVLVQHPEGSVYLFKAVEKGEELELTVPGEEEFDKASKFYEESMEK